MSAQRQLLPVTEKRRPLTVLVADDDDDDRGVIRKAWRENVNNSLRFVEDGQELTEYLNHSGRYSDPASAPRPCIILLDLNMPKKDGREVLEEIKASPELRSIPVVVFTSSQAEDDIRKCYDNGANSYITKPATFREMVGVLQILGDYWIEIVELDLDNPAPALRRGPHRLPGPHGRGDFNETN
jgi:CheY-like chemotaxis protein